MLYFTRWQLVKFYLHPVGLCPDSVPVPTFPRRTRKLLRVFLLWARKMWLLFDLSRGKSGQIASRDRDRDTASYCYLFSFFLLSQCPNKYKNKKKKEKRIISIFCIYRSSRPPRDGTLGHPGNLQKFACSLGVAQ